MACETVAETLKICSRCQTPKPSTVEYFFAYGAGRQGLRGVCKTCKQSPAARAAAADPEAARERRQAARLATKELEKERARQKRRDNPAAAHMRDRATYHAETPERRAKRQAYSREYKKRTYATQGARVRDAAKARRHADPVAFRAWQASYRERKREQIRRWAAARLEANPALRLNARMAQYMRHHLRGLGGEKARRSWETLVGYTQAILAAHIERQFLRGMSWDNMGRWHIDHIVPLSAFSYTSTDDPGFRVAWALSNLRPLWARDNSIKGGRRLHLI